MRLFAPVHDPAPRCEVVQVTAHGDGGASSFSGNAEPDGDGYACAFTVEPEADALVLGATRQEGDRLRILRAQVVEVRGSKAPPRVAFESFGLEEREGAALAVARVPPRLADLRTPAVGDLLPARDRTQGGVLWRVGTPDGRLDMAGNDRLAWQGPREAAAPFDARARVQEAERATGTDLAEDEPVVRALAWAWNDLGYAVSGTAARGYGACAARECFTLEG